MYVIVTWLTSTVEVVFRRAGVRSR
jgi:hypothetical protein